MRRVRYHQKQGFSDRDLQELTTYPSKAALSKGDAVLTAMYSACGGVIG